ncbi:NADH-quinone oxidoreductase subunit L [Longispora sp. NPDC051575]|uniref:NADH-quinone oxidoreductase subunit 5 family protein n=1 Tax=Longispora sp. NPDC051575 TaxID=3154943 RepID=UPI00342971F4
MTGLAWLLPGAPLLAALIGFFLPAPARRPAALIGSAGALVALGAAIALLVGDPVAGHVRLASFGALDVTLGVSVSPVAALVAVAVGVVALCVQVYSAAYLHSDRNYAPYAAQISLFTAAMLTVVVADDLLILLIGWEVMGACSYLLIAHDRSLPEAPAAAVKAFLVTRVGDVGFLLGIAVLAVNAETLDIGKVLAYDYSTGTLTAATLLLLAGVFGKSAQFPLHSWLPDAMAGPTPISALIHAATMVAAGVYVVARLYPLFGASDAAMAVLAVAAAITMLWGACCAMAATDIKKVLAWSTVSQLGYMTGALAVGSPPAALFHLLSHAGFKALLFLCAGAVIHAIGSNAIEDAGGLRKRMPVTFWTMTVGLAALVGIPPVSGFWSKENVLVQAEHAHGWQGRLILIAGLVTVMLTAWYSTRLWLRTFFGHYRGTAKPHDPPALMRLPLLVLAVPAALFGLLALGGWLGPKLGGDLLDLNSMTLVALFLAGIGAVAASAGASHTDPARYLGPLRPLFANAFYFDTVQDLVVVRPVKALARVTGFLDATVVDGAVEGVGTGSRWFGGLVNRLNAPGLPRYATAALAGVLLIAVAALATEVLR